MIQSTRKPEVVVITGASAGVGRATVREFARRRAHVGLLARGEEGLAGAKREVEQAGGKAIVLPTDVSDADAVERAAAEVESQLGPIDIWVNDAMVSVFSPFKEMTAEEFRRVTEVTYLGFVYGTMAALKRMLPRRPRHDRAGRLCARLSRDTSAIGLLRGQAWYRRIYRGRAMRVVARPEQCLGDHGSNARAQYAPIRLGQESAATQAAAGTSHL